MWELEVKCVHLLQFYKYIKQYMGLEKLLLEGRQGGNVLFISINLIQPAIRGNWSKRCCTYTEDTSHSDANR